MRKQVVNDKIHGDPRKKPSHEAQATNLPKVVKPTDNTKGK